jgi:hypothetical protein
MDTQPPAVVVPMNDAMAEEPARTIGQMFADKKLVSTFVSAVVGIISLTFGLVIDVQIVDYTTTVVTLAAMAATAWTAQRAASRRAINQAETTRAAVYAPATVANIVAAQEPKQVDAVVIPAPIRAMK